MPDTLVRERARPRADRARRDPADLAAVADLALRAVEGDSEAFGALYGIYAGEVYWYIYRRVRHHQLAEDLRSETFLRALRRISSFTWQRGGVNAWLYTIARNLVIDHYKTAYWRVESPTGVFEDLEDVADDDGPEDAVIASELRESLHAAIGRLPSAQRQCVTLRLLDGRSVEETAHIMGRTRGAVAAMQNRSLHSLARVLRKQEAEAASAAQSAQRQVAW